MTFIADIYVIAVLLRAAASCKIVVINQMREPLVKQECPPPTTNIILSLFVHY